MGDALERALYFARAYRAVAEEFASDCAAGPHRTLEALVELEDGTVETERERLLRKAVEARRGEVAACNVSPDPAWGRRASTIAAERALRSASRAYLDHIIAEEASRG